MLLVVRCFFIALGFACVALAVAHEVFWWKRRHWNRTRGKVIGFDESTSADGGTTYSAEIEFQAGHGKKTFRSQYGSGTKPVIGSEVEILVSANGDATAEISSSHRIVIPTAAFLLGLVFLLVGLNLQP